MNPFNREVTAEKMSAVILTANSLANRIRSRSCHVEGELIYKDLNERLDDT